MSRSYLILLVLIITPLLPSGCGVSQPKDKETTADAVPANVEQAPFMVKQSTAPGYAPGKDLAVTATLSYTGIDPVTALAFQIALPLGWQFGTVTEGTPPAITPKEGATDTVNMVWIQAPAFPATIAYTVKVPDWAEGTINVDSKAIYRALGGEEQSPHHRLAIQPAP